MVLLGIFNYFVIFIISHIHNLRARYRALSFIYYKDTNVNYRLIGVVTHFGPSGESGHFIAFCKSFVDGNWYRYNDAIVNLSSFNDVKNTGVPYILFYAAQ